MSLSIPPRSIRTACGFSLIELMVTVAIVGMLASIALPSYVSYLARGKRAEAKQALLENALFLETHYTTRGFYSTAKGNNTAPTLPVSQVPRSGSANYTITATVTNTSYTLTAAPTGTMASDNCKSYGMDQTGEQSLWNGNQKITDTTLVSECWNR